MPRPRPLPAALKGRPFSVEEARKSGITRGRLRSGDLSIPFRGVRSPTPTPTTDIHSRAAAYAARMPQEFVFTHTTAAVLLCLRLPDGFRESVLHVTSTAAPRAPRGRGIVGHRIHSPLSIVTLPNGVRTVSPIDVWCQLSATFSVDDLVIMGDGLVRRKHPLATMSQLDAAVEKWRGCRGFRALTEALALIRPRTDSARETILRLLVVRAGFPEPVVNHPIVNRCGKVIAHGDLAFPDYLTLLEYDGGQHRDDEMQYTIDVARLDDIMEERWRTIRVDKVLLRKRAVLLGKIRRALLAGGWPGP